MTLVEILVVMAIILVLGALIITALWKLYKAVKSMFGMGASNTAVVLVWAPDRSDS